MYCKKEGKKFHENQNIYRYRKTDSKYRLKRTIFLQENLILDIRTHRSFINNLSGQQHSNINFVFKDKDKALGETYAYYSLKFL